MLKIKGLFSPEMALYFLTTETNTKPKLQLFTHPFNSKIIKT